jgi:hypothetical protein
MGPGDFTPETIGLPAALIFAGFMAFFTGLLREWWVLGREYRAMQSDRDYWRSRVDRGMQLAERATAVAERSVGGPG